MGIPQVLTGEMAVVARGWIKPHDDMLIALKAEGKSSRIIMDLINQAFGTAYIRNSVIGRSNRLGLQTPKEIVGVKPRSDRSIKPRKRKLLGRSLPPLAFRPTVVDIEPRHITLEDLRSFHCREPYDHPDAATTYCGHTKQPGSSYCAAHHSKNTWRRA